MDTLIERINNFAKMYSRKVNLDDKITFDNSEDDKVRFTVMFLLTYNINKDYIKTLDELDKEYQALKKNCEHGVNIYNLYLLDYIIVKNSWLFYYDCQVNGVYERYFDCSIDKNIKLNYNQLQEYIKELNGV